MYSERRRRRTLAILCGLILLLFAVMTGMAVMNNNASAPSPAGKQAATENEETPLLMEGEEEELLLALGPAVFGYGEAEAPLYWAGDPAGTNGGPYGYDMTGYRGGHDPLPLYLSSPPGYGRDRVYPVGFAVPSPGGAGGGLPSGGHNPGGSNTPGAALSGENNGGTGGNGGWPGPNPGYTPGPTGHYEPLPEHPGPVATVPEPGALLLLLFGLAGISLAKLRPDRS